MRSAEEAALVKVMDGDDEAAACLIAEMLPNERAALQAAALRLSQLASGAASLPDALCAPTVPIQ